MNAKYIIAAEWPNGHAYPVCRVEAESSAEAAKLFLAEAVKLHPKWRATGVMITTMLPSTLPPEWEKIPAENVPPFPEWLEMEGRNAEWDRRVVVFRSSNLGAFPSEPPLDHAYLDTWVEEHGWNPGRKGKAWRETRRAWFVDVDCLEDLFTLISGDEWPRATWGSCSMTYEHIDDKRVPVVHIEDMDWKYHGEQEGIENPHPVWFEGVTRVDLT